MRLPERVIQEIERAREEAFREARRIPEERLEWRPMGVGQSVLSMVRELAKTPDWAYWVSTDGQPDDPDRAASDQLAEIASWRTVDECEAACQAKLVRLFELYRSFSDERLSETKWLSFNGGREHTILELLDYPRWNFVYHTGQIGYVRTLVEMNVRP